MALVEVYSLFDRKLREYGQMVHARNDEAIRRYIVDGIQPGSFIQKHASDFDLVRIGKFDPDTGELVGTHPQLMCNLEALLQEVNGGQPSGA